MDQTIRRVVIVGGGAAGWITAGLLAAKHRHEADEGLKVTVVESPDIPIVGVGEGTWPSMRTTLRTIGVSEYDFLRACNASLKQGSKFVGWTGTAATASYYHPFEAPLGIDKVNMADYWLSLQGGDSFSRSLCSQEALCERHLAPKGPTSPEYAGFSNYGYHLDAGAFTAFLRDHVTRKLGVELVAATMTEVRSRDNGDIDAIRTREGGWVEGDLFIDCTGFRALLLGQQLGVGLRSVQYTLFADTALAVQVPYGADDPVQSTTVATAQPAGWIWDVSLSTRRGIGHVYSSGHMEEAAARTCLRNYLGLGEAAFEALTVRKLAIGSGYRETFWKNNCIAIGLSAGFLEPLEASALMLIERSASLVADNLPTSRAAMDIIARRFNTRLMALWEDIIHFLKLHYCLSARPEPFWRDNRSAESVPDILAESLRLWAEQAPLPGGLEERHDLFPAASYQYVLYGMGFKTRSNPRGLPLEKKAFAQTQIHTVQRNADRLMTMLPTNRALLDIINGVDHNDRVPAQ
jgi:hypothetical protein